MIGIRYFNHTKSLSRVRAAEIGGFERTLEAAHGLPRFHVEASLMLPSEKMIFTRHRVML